jgi:hypothetical protein
MATAPSLFGATPESIQQARDAALDDQANAYAQLDPFQRASAGLYRGGNQLGGAIGRMLGGQDPEMQRASLLRQLGSQASPSTPEGMMTYAQALQGAGFQQEAFAASQQAQQMRLTGLDLTSRQQGVDAAAASQAQTVAFRKAVEALGPSPTQAQLLATASQFGDPKTLVASLQVSADKAESRAQQVVLAEQATAARIEAARQRGEDQKVIAQMQIDGRTQIAQLVSSLKGEKPLTEFQGKALTFGTRAADASNIISSLEGKYNTLSSAYLPAFANSTEGQQVQQAQSNFVNAVLRQESGAAIATSEFDNAKKQYFPQYGDKPAVLAQKKANRERVIKGFSRQAGPGGKDVDEAFNTPTARIEAPAKNTTRVFASESAATAANLPRGTQITINGRKAVVE